MVSSLYLSSCGWAQILPPEYEVDTITQYWVMAHFCCIDYVPVRPWSLTYFPKIGSCDCEVMLNIGAYLEVYRPGSGRTSQAERSMSCLAAANHVLLCTRRTLWTSMVYFYMRLLTSHKCICTVIATTCSLLPLSWNCASPKLASW